MKSIVDLENLLVKPYIDTKDKAYAANIAPVETSPATSAHTAGTQIIYNGGLYDVTADIAANDVLTTTGVGANIAAADDVSKQISNVKQALSNEVGVRSANGAHNIAIGTFGLATLNGATFTPLSDGTIKVYSASAISASSVYIESTPFTLKAGSYVFGKNPEADANMFLMKASDYSNIAVSRTQEDIPFTLANETEVVIRIYAYLPHGAYNNVIYKPLIRWANDADTAWASPAMTNRELTQQKFSYEDNGVLGAKNFWPNGDVTFVRQNSYDLNYAMSGNYILSADVISTDTDDTTCLIYDSTNQTILGYIPRGTQKSVQITLNNTLRIALYASTNYTTSEGDTATFANVMIRLASDTDPTYQPYAMTNRALTEKVIYTKTFTLPSSESWSAESLPTNAKVIAVTANDSGDSLNGTRQYEWYVNTSGATPILCVCPRASTMYSKSCTAFYLLV